MNSTTHTILVQSYLWDHTLAELKELHGVEASVGSNGYTLSMNYSQIASKNDDPLACECRGVVIAKIDGSQIDISKSLGETVILCHGMNRFFCAGMGVAANIPLGVKGSVILEKVDGTCGQLYFDIFSGKWEVSTRSVSLADKTIDGFGEFTFRTLFEKCLKDTSGYSFNEFVSNLNTRHNYIFEITSPYNEVAVKYKDCRLTLLAIRDLNTGNEIDPSVCTSIWFSDIFRIPVVKKYHFDSVDAIVDYVNSFGGSEFEGVVVRGGELVNGDFPRYKLKNANYTMYARIRDLAGKSPRAMMGLILNEKHDDVFALLPEHLAKIGWDYVEKYSELVKRMDAEYDRIVKVTENAENKQKALALATQAAGLYMPYIMHRFAGKCNGFAQWVSKNGRSGEWSSSFLDTLLEKMGV